MTIKYYVLPVGDQFQVVRALFAPSGNRPHCQCQMQLDLQGPSSVKIASASLPSSAHALSSHNPRPTGADTLGIRRMPGAFNLALSFFSGDCTC